MPLKGKELVLRLSVYLCMSVGLLKIYFKYTNIEIAFVCQALVAVAQHFIAYSWAATKASNTPALDTSRSWA